MLLLKDYNSNFVEMGKPLKVRGEWAEVKVEWTLQNGGYAGRGYILSVEEGMILQKKLWIVREDSWVGWKLQVGKENV